MSFFRLTSQILLLAYVCVVGWLAWDIWLLTPHPSHHFKEIMEGGVILLLLPPLWAWLTWRRGAIAAANVCAGSVVWFMAATLGFLWHLHTNEPAVCHAWTSAQTTMVPKMVVWLHQVPHR